MIKIVYAYRSFFNLDRMEYNHSIEFSITDEEYQILTFIESTRIQNQNGNYVFSKPLVLEYCLSNIDWASKYCRDEYGNLTQDLKNDFYHEAFIDEVLEFAPSSFFLYESISEVNPNGPDTGGGFISVIRVEDLKDSGIRT